MSELWAMSAGGSHLVSLVALTTGVGLLMVFLGFRQSLLRPRSEPRRCPSCGQRLRSWTCWSCTDSRGT
jgi:hypothetical protein